MKNRIQIVGIMGIISGELDQLVKACEDGGDHKLADEMTQFSDEFKIRLKREVDDFDGKLKAIVEAMALSRSLEASRRAGVNLSDQDYGELHDTVQRGLDAYASLE